MEIIRRMRFHSIGQNTLGGGVMVVVCDGDDLEFPDRFANYGQRKKIQS
jgi:hypothetical protein